MNFDGFFSVLPTPFAQDGSLDLESLRRVVDLVIDAGVDGMTALGVTGEVDRLNESERHQVLETVLGHANGRVPVVAGATAQGLQTCIELSRTARDAGASAVMVSPPRLVKLNSDAVFAHFARLAEAVDIPIVVQDYPPVSGYTMEPWLLARIAREIPRARAIKLEDPPTPFKTSLILEQAGATPVKILGGLCGVYLIEELLAGASGAMTGFAYPEMLVEVVRLFRSGHHAQAANAFYRYVPLMRFEFQPVIGMAIRKEILRRRGALAAAVVRAPAARLDAATITALDGLLAWMRDGQGVKWISV